VSNKAKKHEDRISTKQPPGVVLNRIDPPPPPQRGLLSKKQVLALVPVTFATIWAWQRKGLFPRAKMVGGKSCWLAHEVDAWIAALPNRPYKGDEKVA